MNIEKIRKDTFSCNDLIHLNNASASLSPNRVIEAAQAFLTLEQSVGPYEAYNMQSSAIAATYEHCAQLLNCESSEIALTQSATAAWHQLMLAIDWKEGDIILTTEADHVSVYLTLLQLKKRYGIKIIIIPMLDGVPDLTVLQANLNEQVKLVHITHLGSHGGKVSDVTIIGKILSNYPCYYAIDAAQSLGQTPIDVLAFQCDFLFATGRKYLRGPRGTGLLYIRSKCMADMHPKFIAMENARVGADLLSYEVTNKNARLFESGEVSFALRLGLAEAVKYAFDLGIENIKARIVTLAEYFIEKVTTLPQMRVINPTQDVSGIVLCDSTGTSVDICKTLQLQSKPINVRTWNQSASPLMKFGVNRDKPLLRFSLHYFNTHEEIDATIQALQETL